MKSLWPVLASAFVVVSGCSATNEIDYGSVNLVAVGGTVTLDGAALPSAVITFEDPETGNFSFARTDSSGNYTLQFDSQANGVLPGKKIVKVSTTRTVLGLAGEEGEEEGESSEEGGGSATSEKQKEAVPACYNKDSKLSIEVTTSTTTFNFDLKSDCTTTTATP
jgi:hypothetical protein